MSTILDNISPLTVSVADISNSNDNRTPGSIIIILAPGYTHDDYGNYERYRQFVIDVLSSTPRIANLNVHERESFLGYPQFIFDFDSEFKSFKHVLRFFRTLFSILAYIKNDVQDIEHTHIYIRENNLKEEEMQTANLFNMTGPHSNLRIIENVSEQVFKIKRPPHYIGTRFNFGYKLVKYKEKESNAIRIY